ncbi:MAG: hypothetical protein ABEJ23_08115 [Haloarculaceae archaeon]
MERRSVLAVLGAAVLPAAGCLEAPVRDGASSSCTGGGHLSFEAEADDFVVETDDTGVETFLFTLRNRTSCSVTVSPGAWRIEREGTDGEPVARGDSQSSERTLHGGDTHQWSLSLTPHPTPYTEETTYVVAALEEGRYAFVVDCALAGQTQVTRRAGFTLVKRS